jgi:hypothetical protein
MNYWQNFSFSRAAGLKAILRSCCAGLPNMATYFVKPVRERVSKDDMTVYYLLWLEASH